jgi:hypothetical protein
MCNGIIIEGVFSPNSLCEKLVPQEGFREQMPTGSSAGSRKWLKCIPELKQHLQSVSYRFALRGNYLNTPKTAFSVHLLDLYFI